MACPRCEGLSLTLKASALAQELEVLETRTQGIKTKAETQAKYGW